MKYLAVLGAGPDQIPAFIQARKLGIPTLAVDYNPRAPGFEFADRHVVASVKHREEVITSLKNQNLSLCGVMTLGVEISPIVAAVANVFGLNAVSQETAYLTTHKCARNRALEKAGIPIARFQVVQSARDIEIQTPFVIKPSDNSGSRGVQIVDSSMDLNEVVETAKKYASDGQVLIEEQLNGPEISIEGFALEGKMFVTGFADRNYTRNPDFYPFMVEDGGDYPTDLPAETVREAKEVFAAAAAALGIQDGPSKGDLIVTKDGVKVLEITSRLSGGGLNSRYLDAFAQYHYLKRNYDQVISGLSQIQNLNDTANYYLGKSLLTQGESGEAFRHLSSVNAVDAFPGLSQELERLKSELGPQYRMTQKRLMKWDDGAFSKREKEKILLELLDQEDSETAAIYVQRYRLEYPNEEMGRYFQARLLLLNGDYLQASDEFHRLANSSFRGYEIYYYAGVAFFKSNKPFVTKYMLERALQTGSKYEKEIQDILASLN